MAKRYKFIDKTAKRSFKIDDPAIKDFLTPEAKAKVEELANQEFKEDEIKKIKFPIEIFPKFIQQYINEINKTLDSSVDFMGAAFMFALSVIVGNTHQIKIKNGWTDRGVLWLAIVGEAGIGKTPATDAILKPLEDLDEELRTIYKKNLEEFETVRQQFREAPKNQKHLYEIPPEPLKMNFLTQQPTPEALAQLHQHNKVSVGILREEFSGWVLDMNKYQAGGEKQFHLSAWALKGAHAERKTTTDNDIPQPFIPVFGGIQPDIFKDLRVENNSDKDGFIDRILLVYPELEIEYWNEKEVSGELMADYNGAVKAMYNKIRENLQYNYQDQIDPITVLLTESAKKEWKRIYNKITDIQRSDSETQYFKSMYPKQKRYIPRFALLIHLALNMFDEETDHAFISANTIKKAEKLSDYFVAMAKKVKYSEKVMEKIEKVIEKRQDSTFEEKLKALYDSNPKFNRSKAAKILDVSRTTIINKLKEFGMYEAADSGRKTT